MSFDVLAKHYDWMETVLAGSILDRARAEGLASLAGCENILSMGEGHGRFARACATRWPEANITCVDASARMLEKARKKMAEATASRAVPPNVTWERADIMAWEPPSARFDALVTCFFLDCFPSEILAQVIPKMARAAKRNAVWLVTDFAIPDRGFWRWRARAVHAAMYAFFRQAASLPARRLTPPDALLQRQGFELERRTEFERGLLRTDVWRRR